MSSFDGIPEDSGMHPNSIISAAHPLFFILQPTLNEKLQTVYKVINDSEKKGLRKLSLVEVSPDMLHKRAIFDFQAAAYSVPENIGILGIIIARTGRMDNEVTIRVSSIEGTAKESKAHPYRHNCPLIYESLQKPTLERWTPKLCLR